MADSASSNNTPTINSLPEFTSDVYVNITPAELAVFAVYTLKSDGHFAATEEIVSACFRLFPNRFALKNYFYWPDSAQIMLHLNEAKEKGDLKGKPADGFAVKVQGRQTVKRVAKVLGVTLPAPEKKVQAPAAAPESKQVEAVSAAGEKVADPQEITSVQPVLSETPVEKITPAPQKKKPIRKHLVKKPPVKVKKKPVAPPAKKQAVVTKKKPVKKKASVPQEKKPVKKLPVKKQVVVEKQKPATLVVAKAPAKKKTIAIKEKKPAILPVVKEVPAKKKKGTKITTPAKKQVVKVVKKTPPKQTAPVKAKELPKPVIVKQATLIQVKAEEPKKKERTKPVAPVVVTKVVAPKKEKPPKQAPVKSAQPAQLTMSLLPAVQEKKEKAAPAVEKKAEPKPIKVEKVIAPVVVIQVSKEEKAKAGKVVQLMERSDAYRQYKKSGDKSKISEFDFRSLLLCTMESSPETLTRNINTFKGYANIQSRQDLVVFLNFVEGSFSSLLKSSGKKLAKKK